MGKEWKIYDSLRPSVEPEGLNSPEDVVENRKCHIARVKELFESLDLFIFTFGLTEMWVHKESGTVYPTAPGTIAGEYNDKVYEFMNCQFDDIIKDFNQFQNVLNSIRGGKSFKCLLTVSPVPLTATGSGSHVLLSTVYSSQSLEVLLGNYLQVNTYRLFPSYEIVTNPRMHSCAFTDNLRSVRPEAVQIVMNHFFAEHMALSAQNLSADRGQSSLDSPVDIQCEEALLDEFSGSKHIPSDGSSYQSCVRVIGNSYISEFMKCIREKCSTSMNNTEYISLPSNWLSLRPKSPWSPCFLEDQIDINNFEPNIPQNYFLELTPLIAIFSLRFGLLVEVFWVIMSYVNLMQ